MTRNKGPEPKEQIPYVCSRIIKVCDEYLGKGQITYEEVFKQLEKELNGKKEKNTNRL
jgi:hypothetical protein